MHGNISTRHSLEGWLTDDDRHRGGKFSATKHGEVLYAYSPDDRLELLPTAFRVLVLLTSVPSLKLSLGAEGQTINATAGTTLVVPATVAGHVCWGGNLEYVMVSISPARMQELALDGFRSADFEITSTNLIFDRIALKLAKLLKGELEAPNHNQLFLESLMTLVGLHVLRSYSSLGGPKRRARATLSTSVTRKVKAYLRENFRRKVSISELAEVGGLSIGHFSEAFASSFGLPPHRYVLELRLKCAERLLRETNIPIPEVSYMSGFSSQSHMTKLMRKHWGTTPHRLRLS